MEPAVIAILGGVLPFGSIFIEMYVSHFDVYSAVYWLLSTVNSKECKIMWNYFKVSATVGVAE